MKKVSAFLIAIAAVLAACSEKPVEPIRIGFIGGLSGPNSDNGQSGLNGLTLAVEQFNRAGGANGRLVEIMAKDDAQSKETAQASANQLVTAKVEAVVGPFTSGMAAVIVPITGQAGIFQISPTITAMEFLGKDDNLYRINRTTRDNAGDYAKVMHSRGQKRIAVAYDLRNRSFTQSWLDEFRTAAEGLSASVAAEVSYESSKHAHSEGVVTKTLQSKPDGLFFFSGALDVARLEQAARQLAL